MALSLRSVRCAWTSSISRCPKYTIPWSESRRAINTKSVDNRINSSVKRVDGLDDLIPASAYVLPPLSPEQQRALEVLSTKDGNVMMKACAGSGKTTTLLQMAKNLKKTFLVLLYNRHLRLETSQRARALNLENTTVDNYHGLGYHYYSDECSTDQGLKRVVQDNLPPLKPLPNFEILVMDEQQDMNPIIFSFVQKVIKDAIRQGQKLPQILSLGDPRQEIYQFNNADKRFLTRCRDLFPESGEIGSNSMIERNWTELHQRTSFRLTQPIADFINAQLLHASEADKMLTVQHEPDNPRPRYVICDELSDRPMKELLRLIDMGLSPANILILAPSLRSKKGGLRHLANQLALHRPDIRIHIPTDEDEDLGALVRLNKVIFATYHQAKGIEREAAIIFNFDTSYHEFFDRHAKPQDKETIGNTQYVAATRAKKHLVLVHHYEHDYLPCITADSLAETCEIIQDKSMVKNKGPVMHADGVKSEARRAWPVTSLVRNIPENVMSKCFGLLELEHKVEPRPYRVFPVTQIEIASGMWQGEKELVPSDWEGVAEITGTAVPAIFQWEHTRQCKMAYDILKPFERLKSDRGWKALGDPLNILPEEHVERLRLLRQCYDAAKDKEEELSKLSISDILFLANISCAKQSGFLHKVLSIPSTHYNWYTQEHADAAFEVLVRQISSKAFFERTYQATIEDVVVQGQATSLIGVFDVLDYYRNTLWELKWTNTLRPEHVLQTALYAIMDDAFEKKKAARKLATLSEEDPGTTQPQQESNPRRSRQVILMHVPTGQQIRIRPKNLGEGRDAYKELLETLVRAKVDEPNLEVSDAEFLRQSATGFRDLIGPMTIPPWLNCNWFRVHPEARRAKGSKEAETEN